MGDACDFTGEVEKPKINDDLSPKEGSEDVNEVYDLWWKVKQALFQVLYIFSALQKPGCDLDVSCAVGHVQLLSSGPLSSSSLS